MLTTWNAENITKGHGGPSHKGLKAQRKALSEAGSGSENVPTSTRKGATDGVGDAKARAQRRALGVRSENNPSAAGGKSSTAVGRPKLKQRKALGDISNASKTALHSNSGNNFKSSTKQPTAGLKFSVHNDTSEGSSARKASTPKREADHKKGNRAIAKVDLHVHNESIPHSLDMEDDVEMVMGRTWEEEEALVQQRAEEKAFMPVNHFRLAPTHGVSSREKLPPLAPKQTAPKATTETSGARHSGSGDPKMSADDDRRSQGAMDTVVLHDFAGPKEDLKDEDFDTLNDPIDDMDPMVHDLCDSALSLAPLSPLDDAILTQELDINFV